MRHSFEDRPLEASEEFANFAETGLWIRDQPDLVDAAYGHERDQRQERGGLVAVEDEVLDRAERPVEEVFGVAIAAAVKVDRRLRLSPDVDLAQDRAVYIGVVIHTPDVVPKNIHRENKNVTAGDILNRGWGGE